MNESMGNSGLLYIVIFVLAAVMLLVVGAISYSKGYKTKNRIIQMIEKYENYENIKTDVDADLNVIGYQRNRTRNCPIYSSNNISENLADNTYNYCVYKICVDSTYDTGKKGCKDSNSSYYYKVITYSSIELPVINSLFQMEVKGETKIMGKNYNY